MVAESRSSNPSIGLQRAVYPDLGRGPGRQVQVRALHVEQATEQLVEVHGNAGPRHLGRGAGLRRRGGGRGRRRGTGQLHGVGPGVSRVVGRAPNLAERVRLDSGPVPASGRSGPTAVEGAGSTGGRAKATTSRSPSTASGRPPTSAASSAPTRSSGGPVRPGAGRAARGAGRRAGQRRGQRPWLDVPPAASRSVSDGSGPAGGGHQLGGAVPLRCPVATRWSASDCPGSGSSATRCSWGFGDGPGRARAPGRHGAGGYPDPRAGPWPATVRPRHGTPLRASCARARPWPGRPGGASIIPSLDRPPGGCSSDDARSTISRLISSEISITSWTASRPR